MSYRSDFHCHSDISPDSRTDLVDLARAAADKGLSELCVTEHWECGHPCADWQERKKPFDIPRYLERFEAARSALGHRIDLRLGLELGNYTQDPAHAHRGMDALPLDFVISSLHTISGEDAYFFDYTQEDMNPHLRAYLEECLELARQQDYDSFGHLALPLRYAMIHAKRRLSFDACQDILDDVLREIARNEKALEANTSGYRSLGEPVPSVPVLRRFRELGGKLVTIGSDGHNEEHVGSFVEETMAALREAGFTRYVTYEQRRPVWRPL